MLRKNQGKATTNKPLRYLSPHHDTLVDRHVVGSNAGKVVELQLELVVGKPVAEAQLAELVVLVELHDSDCEQPSPCEDSPKQRYLGCLEMRLVLVACYSLKPT